MNLRDFSARARAAAPPGLSRIALDAALLRKTEGLGTNQPQEWDIPDVIQLARRLETSLGPASGEKTKAASTGFTGGQRELILSDHICDALEPRVKELRLKLFGNENVPFKNWKRATEWLVSTAEFEHKGVRRPPANTCRKMVRRLAKKLRCGLGIRHRDVEYPMRVKGELWTGRARAIPGGKLYLLALECHSLAEVGFLEPAVTWWVLLGIRPIIPRYRITEHYSQWISSATIELNAADLSWDELWGIFKKLRRLPNVKRQKVNRLHYRIYQIVREKGGVPEERKVAFWISIREQLISERGLKVPGTWNAIRKAYYEVVEVSGVGADSQSIQSDKA